MVGRCLTSTPNVTGEVQLPLSSKPLKGRHVVGSPVSAGKTVVSSKKTRRLYLSPWIMRCFSSLRILRKQSITAQKEVLVLVVAPSNSFLIR